MANYFNRGLLRVAIAQICLTVGYNSTQNTPLELLQDVLNKFLLEFSRELRRHVENYNRTEANLNDALLSLLNLNINIHELMGYIINVEPVPFVIDFPKYPSNKPSSFNFLKPGSKEVLSRPVHVFEYLPPMLPLDLESISHYNQINNNNNVSTAALEQQTSDELTTLTDKECKIYKFQASNQQSESSCLDKFSGLQNVLFDEGFPTREISSVVMTTGGFISPAMEGKIPDSIIPDLIEKYNGLDVAPPVELVGIVEMERCLDEGLSKISKKIELKTKTNDCTKKSKIPVELMDNNFTKNVENDNLNTKYSFEPTIASKNQLISSLYQNLPQPEACINEKKIQKTTSNNSSYNIFNNALSEKTKRKKLKLLQKTRKSNRSGNNKLKEKHISAPGAANTNQSEKILKKQGKHQQKISKDQLYEKSKHHQLQLQGGLPIISKNVELEKSCLPKATEESDLTIKKSANSILELPFPKLAKISEHESTAPSSGLLEENSVITNINTNEDHEVDFVPKMQVYKDIRSTSESEKNLEVKLQVLPDRSKLDIFKKISKQKSGKELPPIVANSFVLSSQADNVLQDRPLINLPSGTTITPAPLMEFPNEVYNFQDTSLRKMHGLNQFSPLYCTDANKIETSSSIINLNAENKPKKRGRKPGSKNQPKVNANSVYNMQLSPINMKNTKFENKLHKNILGGTAIPSGPEQLNLININEYSSNHFDVENSTLIKKDLCKNENETITKEKKQKKKKKLKSLYSRNDCLNFLSKDTGCVPNANFNHEVVDKQLSPAISIIPTEMPNEFHHISPSKKITSKQVGNKIRAQMPSDSSSNFSSVIVPSVTTCQTNITSNMFPILPLLGFPTRPGLIPSAGMFSGNGMATLTNPCQTASSAKMLINSLLPFGNLKTGLSDSDIFKDKRNNESKSTIKLTDHNFCNVPPLIPEFMSTSSPSRIMDTHCLSKIKSVCSPKYNDTFTNLVPNAVGYNTSQERMEGCVLGPSQKKIAATSFDDIGLKTNYKLDCNKTLFQKPTMLSGNDGNHLDLINAFGKRACNPIKQELSQNIQMSSNELIELSDDSNDFIQSETVATAATVENKFSTTNNIISVYNEHSKKLSSSLIKDDYQTIQRNIKKQKYHDKKLKKNVLINLSPANSMLNDKGHEKMKGTCYEKLAGGAELIPLIGVSTGLAYSSKTVPTNSLTGNTLINKEPSQIDTTYCNKNLDDVTITAQLLDSNDLKKNKEHKKPKKLKDGKIKKKKEKKDKIKNKDRTEKYLPNDIIKHDIKKLKKNKKKEKQQTAMHLKCTQTSATNAILPLTNQSNEFDIGGSINELLDQTTGISSPTPQVPKLTLKFSENKSLPVDDIVGSTSLKVSEKRESSPELARISPLVTGPPKQKSNLDDCTAPNILNIQNMTETAVTSSAVDSQLVSKNVDKNCDSLRQSELVLPNPWLAGGTLTASSVLLPQQLIQKTDNKKSVVNVVESVGSECRPSSYVDAEGNIVWICPACGKVDDGSAMIGCDGCDAWYHWICVGISVAPKDNEDWYCRLCVSRKKGTPNADKKRKRNKKK